MGLTLESYIEYVKNERDISSKNKNDALKVLNCLLYIKLNMDKISLAFEHRKERKTYASQSDYEHGVLRDHHGVSFHLNSYKTGEEAIRSLTQLVQQVENVLTDLPAVDRIRFADHLRYDENVGCLEARLGPAVAWAVELKSIDIPKLDDIIKFCHEKYECSEKNISKLEFIENYCKSRNYQVCMDQGEEKKITRKLLIGYLRDILCEEPDENDIRKKRGDVNLIYKISSDDAISTIQNENAIIKIVQSSSASPNRDRAWGFLLSQLADPECARPSRKNQSGNWKPRQGLLKDVVYPGTLKNKKKNTELSKKTPTSLLPADGRMQFFSAGQEYPGLLFDLTILTEIHRRERKNPEKNAFLYNAFTNGRHGMDLRGDATFSAIRQRNRAKRRNGTVPLHNEIVIRPAACALKAVFATRNSPEARLMALQKKYLIMSELRIGGLYPDLPVLIINYGQGVTVYTEEMQRQDLIRGINSKNSYAIEIEKLQDKIITEISVRENILQEAGRWTDKISDADILQALNLIPSENFGDSRHVKIELLDIFLKFGDFQATIKLLHHMAESEPDGRDILRKYMCRLAAGGDPGLFVKITQQYLNSREEKYEKYVLPDDISDAVFLSAFRSGNTWFLTEYIREFECHFSDSILRQILDHADDQHGSCLYEVLVRSRPDLIRKNLTVDVLESWIQKNNFSCVATALPFMSPEMGDITRLLCRIWTLNNGHPKSSEAFKAVLSVRIKMAINQREADTLARLADDPDHSLFRDGSGRTHPGISPAVQLVVFLNSGYQMNAALIFWADILEDSRFSEAEKKQFLMDIIATGGRSEFINKFTDKFPLPEATLQQDVVEMVKKKDMNSGIILWSHLLDNPLMSYRENEKILFNLIECGADIRFFDFFYEKYHGKQSPDNAMDPDTMKLTLTAMLGGNVIFSEKCYQKYIQPQGAAKFPSQMKNMIELLCLVDAKLRDLYSRGHMNAAAIAWNLHGELRQHLKNFHAGHMAYPDFKFRCDNAIARARPVLETHRGWKQILGNIALAVAGLGVGYLIGGLFNLAVNKRFLFFRTDAAHQLDKAAEMVNKLEPTFSRAAVA